MKWVIRIFGALFGILVLGVVVLAAMGMRDDAKHLATSVTIHRSPAEVYPWIYEGDKVTQWVSWLKSVKRNPGPPVAGEQVVWMMEDPNNGGQGMSIHATVEAAEPNRRIALQLSTPGAFHGRSQYILTDLGNGSTKVETDSHYEFDMWFARLMSPLIMPQAKQKMVGDLDRLRAKLEAK